MASSAATPEALSTAPLNKKRMPEDFLTRWSPEATLQTLAAQSQMPALGMNELNALTVDFSSLSFNEAARRWNAPARFARHNNLLHTRSG